MNKTEFRFFHRMRVRWAEVDAQEIVFNAHYLTYFDNASSDYWRVLGLPYPEGLADLGGDLYVKKATLEYSGSARFDELLDVGFKCLKIGTTSLTFGAAIFRGGELLVSGELVYVFADSATQKPLTVPQNLRQLLLVFEEGESVIDVKVGAWSELGKEAREVRTEVFVGEQRIPKDLEWDDADEDAIHAVAYNKLGRALGTARLLVEAPGLGRIGRVAVRRNLRGSGVGRQVLEALLEAAKARGDREVKLHAQLTAVPFFIRAGLVARGSEFEEAGIMHVEMAKSLAT